MTATRPQDSVSWPAQHKTIHVQVNTAAGWCSSLHVNPLTKYLIIIIIKERQMFKF